MYTAVLVLAMTTGAESVEFGRRGGCSGCSAYACSGSRHGCHGGYGCSTYARPYGCSGAYHHGCCSSGAIHGRPVGVVAAPATIIVNVPADARLTFNGAATTSTGERRTFTSPTLEVGPSYVYVLRAEVISKGQTIIETREVTVRAGETSVVQFTPTRAGIAGR